MGKFGLRGLAQSLAREFQPQGLHIAHFVIDGGIRSAARPDDGGDAPLDPDAIAETYYQVARQHRSAWSWEVELLPWRAEERRVGHERVLTCRLRLSRYH